MPFFKRVRTSKTMRPVLAALGIVSWATAAVSQDLRGTADQRAACTPDAFRLCASYIPDASKVEMCLRNRKSDLSAACRSVFSQNPSTMVGLSQ